MTHKKYVHHLYVRWHSEFHCCVCVCLVNLYFFLLTYRFSDSYSVCAIGGQHDGYLHFSLPGFVKLNMLLMHVLFAVAEINILPLFAKVQLPVTTNRMRYA